MELPDEIEFDDQGRPTDSVDFDYEAIFSSLDGTPPQSTDEELERQEKIYKFVRGIQKEVQRRLLAVLIAGDSVETTGLRAHLIAKKLGFHTARTDEELAARLGMSKGNLSKRKLIIANGCKEFKAI